MKRLTRFAVAFLAGAISTQAENATINIDATKAGPEINPRMYGIFLEEINTGVDGGLYGELIRNRGFEDAKAPEGFVYRDGHWDNGRGYVIPYHFETNKSLPYWSLVKEGGAQGSMSLDMDNPLTPETPRSCRLQIQNASSGRIGIANEGYWGISVKKGEKYRVSFWSRSDAVFKGPLTATLESSDGKPLSDLAKIKSVGRKWKQFTATLTAGETDPQGRFVLLAGSNGTVWFDMVSLFPEKTFMNRANGMRPDIAQMIADLKPGFVRFPGGCVVEGATPENAYDWKKGIGPLEQREEIWNVWDYRRTHGVGFYEYLQFIEDIHAEPLYVGFAGQTCIYRHSTNVPMSEMQPIETSFLDALEYANGPKNSTWGKLRTKAGHPAPFNLKMLEIGNENEGHAYAERYAAIYPLVKSNYPAVTALACFPQRNAPTEMVDEHYYNNPRWFVNNFRMYDDRDRKSPPVYIAEVAVTSNDAGRDRGNLLAALSEGVFLMGAERNGDVVRMVSYAPLLANVHGRTELAGAPPPWHGMIYFDSSRAFGTVSYYLWKLLGENRPDHTVATDITFADAKPMTVAGQIGVGTWDTSAEFKDIRVEKDGQVLYSSDFSQSAEGWQPAGGRRTGGRWAVSEGAYRQSQPGRASSYFGEESWTDYTLTLKARKLGGGEGFLITFGRKAGDMYWWNLGGWGNTRHAVEHSVQATQTPVGPQVEGTVETGRWYDIKIEVAGNRIRCSLDGKLIHDVMATPTEKFFAVAGPDKSTGDIIVKAINTDTDPIKATLRVAGTTDSPRGATITELTSGQLSDNNSLEDPRKVMPASSKVEINGTEFSHEFAPHSLTVIRLHAGAQKTAAK